MNSMKNVEDALEMKVKLQNTVHHLSSQLEATNGAMADLKAQLAKSKQELEQANGAREIAKKQLHDEMAKGIIREGAERQRMLERGSVASLLASFYMAPTRCPHCGHGLSDTLGLEVLAAACGTRSIDELVELMVRSLSEGASVTYQRTLADHVALLAPPTTFARACTFVGNIPSALMYIPQRYFILFLDETNFVSESQAYALAVQYITTGARFELSEENIECVLDSVRFLWLNVGLNVLH